MPNYWLFRLQLGSIARLSLLPGLLIACGLAAPCCGDTFIIGPTPCGPLGNPCEVGTIYPFLLKETTYSTNAFYSMRYQQVYNRSLFTNLSPDLIYISSLQFFTAVTVTNLIFGWTVPSMQINLSTTSKSADGLSPVFSENVGPDDTVVFGPGSYYFPGQVTYNQFIQLIRPFRYNPPLGNLLVDVRIFDGSGPWQFNAQLGAFDTPADEASRCWATNVTASIASGMDTIGLDTLFGFSPLPSLGIEFVPHICQGCASNLVLVRWPPQPTNFVLQTAGQAGSSAIWHTATNQILGSPDPQRGGWFIEIPANVAGPAAYYRLLWPNGQQ